jgi:HsdM-like protein
MSDSATIVQKLWNYCNVLRDDGLSYQDYLEQLTFLLFLKMADEHAVKLLHSQDRKALKYGAIALALAAKCQSGLSRYSARLVAHASDEVRVVVASMAPLDEVTQRILVADSSPQVRIRLASRARELDEDIIAALSADEHPDVIKALASGRHHQAGAPEHGGAPGR